jgi:hypothetical protein
MHREANTVREAIAKLSAQSAAQVGAADGAENKTKEALIADALEAFQKRDGYHKEVIVDLLQDFGAVLLERAAVGASVVAGGDLPTPAA